MPKVITKKKKKKIELVTNNASTYDELCIVLPRRIMIRLYYYSQ